MFQVYVTCVAVLGAHPQPQHQSPALPSSRDPANFTIPPHRTTISNATPGECEILVAVPLCIAER